MNGTKIITNVIWKFAERILAQLVSLAVSVVLARILLPDDYGAVSMVTVFISVADVFVTDGIPAALIQKEDADQRDFSSVFYFNLILSLVIYLVLFSAAPVIAWFYDEEVLSAVIRVMGLRIIIASINSVQHAYVSKHMMFKKYFWSTLWGTVLSGIIGIGMAYAGFGVWALAMQYMVNTTVDTIVLFITVKWKPERIFSWKRIKELSGFGWKILFEALSNTFSAQIRNLIIGKVYMPQDLGCYTKGQQFPSVIVNNISASVSAVLFPAIAAKQSEKENVKFMLRKAVKTTTYVVFPMLTGLAFVAKPFVSVILTEKWMECVPYLQIYCLLTAASVGMYPRHQALNGTGRSDVFMAEHIFARIISMLLLLFVYRISVMAIAVSGIASTAVLSLTVMYTSRHYNGYLYREQIEDVIGTVAACGAMAVPLVLIQRFAEFTDSLMLAVLVITGALVYLFISAVFKMEGFVTIKKLAVSVLAGFGK